jgi:hypothetical protein
MALALITDNGACGGFATAVCANTVTTATAQTETFTYTTAATTGVKYYIKVFNITNNVMNFNITITGPPKNDECVCAVPLTPALTCSPTAGSVSLATVSASVPTTCSSPPASTNDVWYSFVASSSAHNVNLSGLDATLDGVVEAFSGSCGAYTSIGCTNLGGLGVSEVLALDNLNIGTTYYVRVYHNAATPLAVGTGDFSICVTTPPVNNLCTGAIDAGLCRTVGDFTYATPVPTFTLVCPAAPPTNPDLWYKFTTVATGTVNIAVSNSSTLNSTIGLYSGTCASLNALSCTNPVNNNGSTDVLLNFNLVSTGTYYIRLTPGASIPSSPTFSLMVNAPPRPGNDVPYNVFPSIAGLAGYGLTANTTCVPTAGTVLGATRTFGTNAAPTFTVNPTSGCGSTTNVPDDDVWYYFTPSTSDYYTINLCVSATMDGTFEISTAGNPYSGSALNCLNLGGVGVNEAREYFLVGGSTYFIRVYDARVSTAIPCPYDPTFSICITQSPVNNSCGTPTSITTNSVTCSPTAGTVGGATADGFVACSGFPDNDVWYTFVATSSSHIITLTPSAGMDAAFQVLTGACGSASLNCANANGVGVAENAYLSGLALGQTYYVRVYDARATVVCGTLVPSTSTFSICVTTPPSNDDCPGAINLISNTTGLTSAGPTNMNLATQSIVPCVGSTANDVWYTFSAVNTTQIVTVNGSGGFDPAFQIYTGNCSGLVAVAGSCTNNITGANTSETYTLAATVGVVYSVRVFGFNGSAGTFAINVRHPLNDLCSQATTLNCGDVVGGTTSGATNTGAPLATCNGVAAPISNPGVWYTFTTSGVATSYTVTVCNPLPSTAAFVRIYTGSCGSFTCVATTNNIAGTCNTAVFSTAVATTYYFYVTSASSSNFTISVNCAPTSITPDICAGATPVTCPGVYTANTFTATTTGNPAACGTPVTTAGVWYVFTGNGNSVVADLCTNLSYDNKLSVYSGNCNALTCVTGNDDFCGLGATVNFGTIAGVNYYIFVHGYANNVGNFTLTINCVTPPANDLCQNAQIITCNNIYAGTTLLATTTGDYADNHFNSTACFSQGLQTGSGYIPPFSASQGAGVWYLMQDVGASSTATISTCNNPSYDSQIRVYQVNSNDENCSSTSLSCIAGNDDNPGPGCYVFSSSVTFPMNAGLSYYVFVSGWNGGTNNFNLNVSASPCLVPLPIELLTFDGFPQGSNNKLLWKTASELNNNYFELERSSDAINFTAIGRVQGSGNSTTMREYTAVDENPNKGVTYYRLNQVDYNGQSSSSGIISIDRNRKDFGIKAIRPNPTNDNVNIDFYSLEKASLRIQILNHVGSVVSEQMVIVEEGNNTLVSQLKEQPQGMYTIRIINDKSGWSGVSKVIKN